MLKHILIFMLTISLTITSFGQKRTWTGYRVYSAVLNSSNLDTAFSIVILNQLEVENHSAGLVEAIKSSNKQMIYFYTKTSDIDNATLQLIVDYYEVQSKKPLVATGFNLPVQVKMIDKASLSKMFKPSVEKGWTAFDKQYPNSGGLIKLSKVHFSKDTTTAVFYLSHQQAGLKGYGDLVVMEKVGNDWQVKYRFSLWQS
jgi:hypothetical protein